MKILQSKKIESWISDYDLLASSPKKGASFRLSVLAALLEEERRYVQNAMEVEFKTHHLVAIDNGAVNESPWRIPTWTGGHPGGGGTRTTAGCRTRLGC